MTTEVITQLVSKLEFKADIRPLRAWERALDDLSRKLKLLERQFANSKLGQKLQPASAAKQSKEQFQTALQASKLQLVTAKAVAGVEQQQAKAAAQKAKATAAQDKTQAAQRKFSLQHEQQMLKLQQERQRAQATHSRTQAAMARAQATQAAAEAKLAKLSAGAKNSYGNSRWPSRFSGASRAMFGASPAVPRPMGMSLDVGGIGRLGGVAGSAAVGVAGLATAVGVAAYALKQFATQATEAGAAQQMRTAQFTALTENTGSTPKAAESKFRELANMLGLSIKDTTDPYAKGLTGMVDGGMKLGQGQDVMKGILSYAKASNLGNDDQQGVLRAIGQMMSKGQLYAEEWGGQFAERMAGAGKLGAEAWAEVSKSGLKGDKAAKDFKQATEDGKIAGDKLRTFLMALAARMEADAKRGGKLDTAINNPESQRNRVQNIQQQNLVSAAEYDNGRLTKSAQTLGKSWAAFNEQAKPVYEALSGPAAGMNERLAQLLDTLAPQLPKLAKFIDSLSAFTSSVKDAPETKALGTELVRLTDNLSPVLDAVQRLATIGVELSKTAAKHGAGTLAGDLMVINDTLEAIPAFFDRLGKIVERIKAKVDWLKSFIPDLPSFDTPEDKERRSNYSGVPQWTKPTDAPQLPVPSALRPEWLNSLDSRLNNPALQASMQTLQNNRLDAVQAPAPQLIDNRQVNVAKIEVNGSNLSAGEIGDALQGRMADIARNAFQQELQTVVPNTTTQKR